VRFVAAFFGRRSLENLITAAVLFSCVLGAALLAEKAPPLPKEVPTYPVVVPSRTHTVLRVSVVKKMCALIRMLRHEIS